jgi:hypothetical protein
MLNRHTEIGEIINVSGNLITVELFDNLKSNMPIINGIVYRIGQIGSFLKIPVGYANLLGIVTQVGANAIPDNLKEIVLREGYDRFPNRQWLSMVLVGEQLGRRFERGVSQSPTTGDKVHLVTINDMEIIYGGLDEKSAVTVGNISATDSLNAKLDLDKLISRHCAILGSTGSGKSNAVVVLLNAITQKKFKSARILVIDPHGEYNSAIGSMSKVYKINANPVNCENELYIPFWALPFNEFLGCFSTVLSDTNQDYIREKITAEKVATAEKNNLSIEREIISADSPIPFSINKIWFELDDFERKTYKKDRITECLKTKGSPEELKSSEYEPVGIGSAEPFQNNSRKGILSFLDNVKVRLKDSRYRFLFKPGPYSPDISGKTESDLDVLLHEWLSGNKPITILDLSGVPPEISSSISGTLLKIIYDSLFWGQNLPIGGKEQPLLIVLEEAHTYLKSGENSVSSRTVQTIAKEGRKYGVGLMMVTQRPSELDETVLSQCGTVIALRMNNTKDRGHVKAAIQDELQTLIDLLPSLRTGEAIVSGEGVRIPSRIMLYKAANMPKSQDPSAVLNWQNEKNNAEEHYFKLLTMWRNQKIKED